MQGCSEQLSWQQPKLDAARLSLNGWLVKDTVVHPSLGHYSEIKKGTDCWHVQECGWKSKVLQEMKQADLKSVQAAFGKKFPSRGQCLGMDVAGGWEGLRLGGWARSWRWGTSSASWLWLWWHTSAHAMHTWASWIWHCPLIEWPVNTDRNWVRVRRATSRWLCTYLWTRVSRLKVTYKEFWQIGKW